MIPLLPTIIALQEVEKIFFTPYTRPRSKPHGEWLPWLEENEQVLGFGDVTARRMIRVAEANQSLTHNLDDSEALTISRQLWGKSVVNDTSESFK